MFCGLGEEKRTNLGRKKRKKKEKEKNLIAAKSRSVGMKGYLKTYSHVKYFLCSLLKPFFNETAFYAKLSGRFSGPKTKSRD